MNIKGQEYKRLAEIAAEIETSQAYVYNAVKRGDLPAIRFAGKLYVSEKAAADWIASSVEQYTPDPNEDKK